MGTSEDTEHRLQQNGHSNNGHIESVPEVAVLDAQESFQEFDADPSSEVMTAEVPLVVEASVKQHRIRRFLGKAALVGAAFVSASALGMMLRGTDTPVAGLSANTRPTVDDRLTIHTGLTGSISIPMENFTHDLHGLGASIRVNDGQDASEEDFAGIISLLANADPYVNNVENGAWHWATLYGFGGVLGLYAISKSKLINPEWREHVVQGLGSENTMRFVMAATMLAGASIPATHQLLQAEPTPNVSPVFDNSFLEGATATGWMNTLINNVGVEIVDRVEGITTFSDQASRAVDKAFDNEPKLFKTDGTVTVVSFAGLHCNPAMMPIIGKIIHRAHANFAINAGDEVVGQESLDQFCLYNLASQTKGVEMFDAEGNHRTNKTIQQAEAEGIVELEAGKIYEEDGLTITGAPDPYPDASLEQEQYDSHHPKRPVLGRQVAEAAHKYQSKEHKQVTIAVLNQPGAATPVAKSGYVDSVITGGVTSDVQSLQNGDNETTFTFESSAGGVVNIPDVDQLSWAQPPLAPANVYIDNYDPHTGKKLWSKVITVDPTGDKPTATITSPSITSFGASKAGQKILFGS